MIALVTGGSAAASHLGEAIPKALAGRRYYFATMQVVDDECQLAGCRHRRQGGAGL
jgi:adenosyl cobinamide kinase/adenosyl cobinamide phosphate guanylyltransferase